RLGRRPAGRPGRAGAAGPLPDRLARAVGGIERRPGPDRRRHAGRDPRVRRPPDHRAVLVQGGRPGRDPALRRRPRTRRPAGGHDTEWLTEDQLRAAPARVPLAAYRRFFSDLPNGLGSSIQAHWGPPPGELYTDERSGDIVLACLRFGNVVLMIQPPRGFGE